MKKIKLFLATAALLCSVGSWAYTVDDLTSAGWTQVTSSSITGNADNYYVLVDANSSAYVMANQADHFRPCYKTIDNPVANPSFVWILEGSNNEFNLKSYSTGAYFKQASGWNTSMGNARDSRTKVTGVFELSEGKYTLKCKESGSYVGHWNDDGAAVASDGENIAANKQAKDAPGFFLYAISKATFDAALAESRSTSVSSATKESPVDVTSYIQNADWSGDWGGWESTFTSSGNMQWGQQTLESWNASNVIVKQELRGVPNGTYRLTADVISGPGATKAAYVYGIGTSKVTGSVVSAEASAGNYNTMSSEVAGKTLTADNIVVGNNTITIGIDQSAGWIVADNFKLYYLGVDLEEFINAYNTALTTAQSYEGNLFDEDWATLSAVITANTLNTASATQDELTNATDNLNAANEVAAGAAAKYTTYTTANTLINGGENVDLTSLIINPSFEDNFTGWTNTGSMAIQGNTSFGKTGSNYCEYWQPNGTKGVSQTIAVLPAGRYSMTVRVKARGVTSAKVFAAGIDQAVTIEDAENEYTVNFALDDKAEALIGFEGVGTGAGASWLALDNFRLKYVGALPASLTAVTGKMNATVSATQTSAVEAYNSNQTVANYNAAQAAITAAETSKAAYEKAATALADANALKDAHNFATAAATTTFAEAIAVVQAKYDEGTLTNDEANAGGSLGTVVVGWHADATSTPAAVYMKSAMAEVYTVNDWSLEGETDGSDFRIPFFEYWIADDNSLAAKTMSGTLNELPNGQYKISALIRVRTKNGVAATDATGVTLDVNGGDATDATEGTQVGETQFTLSTVEALGLVKDGKLTFNVKVLDGTNISWLSFKNVKYTKVRDLTPEEAAVTPADLSLDATSTVYKGKTVTLVPTSSTEGASIEGYLNWSSDNESVATVANGVVTGVAYGTANITVTSTLNGEATATCEVTVTAPLITEAVNLDFAEGPVVENHIRTYAKDKTGTDVAQMQEVTGWTIVENGDAKAAGVMAYGSSYGMGSNSSGFYAPATNPNGEAIGNVFGMVGVWTGSVQYVQNVKLPAGAYTITVPVYRNGGASALSKNLIGVVLDDATEYLATTTTYTSGSWTTETIKFNIASETYGKLSIGLNAPNKGSADSQRLWIDGFTVTYEPFATTEEIAALNDAIEAAEAYTLGFEVGEYAPYMNAAALQALAAAKALDTENPVSQSDVTGATTALNGATWTANAEELNAVYDGTFAAAENNGAPAGWTMSNSTLGGATHSRAFVGDDRLSEFNGTNSAFFIRFDGTYSDRGSLYYYGNTAGYTMPLKAGVTYYVKADIACWGSENKTQRMNITGPEGFSAKSQDVTLTSRADNADNDPQQFLIVFQATVDGNYVINFQTPGSDDNKHNAVVSNIELKKATPATLKISDALYATFVAPFEVTIPDGVTAYTVGEPDNDLLTLTEVTTTIPANHPVVLQSEDEVDARTVYGYATPVAEPKAGILTGVYEATVAPVGSYVLQKQDKVAFYKVVEDNQPTVGANRAYLTAPANVDVKAFFFDEATAIKSVFDGVAAGNIYDMAGRKVSKMQKGGVYVVNGKKVVIK